jgi:hypothetical protein
MSPKLFTSLVLLLFLNGCTAYRLGSMLPADIQTVFMPTVGNVTQEPLLENEVTTAIMAELQRDGSLTPASEAAADALMSVRITGYDLRPLSFTRDNRSQPDQYRLTLRADVELVERETGKTLVRSSNVTGENEFPFAGDITEAKRTGLPGAASDLGRVIVATVTEAWVE